MKNFYDDRNFINKKKREIEILNKNTIKVCYSVDILSLLKLSLFHINIIGGRRT